MRYYEDVASHRKRSVLPPELQHSLVRLRDSIRAGRVDPHELTTLVSDLSLLPSEAYLQAAREIIDLGGLHQWHEPTRFFRLIGRSQPDYELLLKTPNLEYLYLFHGNGYLREQSLAEIDGPIESAFYFNSIAYRLNDWAEPVRKAAQACAARVFPQTSTRIIAEAAFVLLERMRHWQRRDKEAEILEETFARADVIEQLSDLIETAITGSPSRVLLNTLRQKNMDAYLLKLSRLALQPSVRALALKSLIQGYAAWPDGFRREWTDKSMGQFRRVPTFHRRELDCSEPVEALLAQGAVDKAAIVRKVAADGLVQHRRSLNDLDVLLDLFVQDKSRAVKERANFILNEKEQGLL